VGLVGLQRQQLIDDEHKEPKKNFLNELHAAPQRSSAAGLLFLLGGQFFLCLLAG